MFVRAVIRGGQTAGCVCNVKADVETLTAQEPELFAGENGSLSFQASLLTSGVRAFIRYEIRNHTLDEQRIQLGAG